MAILRDHLSVLRCAGCGRAGVALCRACDADVRLHDIPSHDPRLVARWRYEGAARNLVLAMKLRGDRDAAFALADGITRAVHAHGLAATCLTWVPGRALDTRRRGFDHAGLLAEEVARRTGLPCRRLLRRLGTRPDQAGLTAEQRMANLVGAFEARGDVPASVAVVDDLVTTGATLKECSTALAAAGATRVECLVACMVP
ncbi:MAG TPA: ComF family protein [Actinomycetota bacterium]|nr:ComF family protein [Actinomycetota bacterium]